MAGHPPQRWCHVSQHEAEQRRWPGDTPCPQVPAPLYTAQRNCLRPICERGTNSAKTVSKRDDERNDTNDGKRSPLIWEITPSVPTIQRSDFRRFGDRSLLGTLPQEQTLCSHPDDSAVMEAAKDNRTQTPSKRGRHFIGCPQEVWSHGRRRLWRVRHNTRPRVTSKQKVNGFSIRSEPSSPLRAPPPGVTGPDGLASDSAVR